MPWHEGHPPGRPVPNGTSHTCPQSAHSNALVSAISTCPPSIRKTIPLTNAWATFLRADSTIRPKGLSGYGHPLGNLLLIQPFVVGQPQGLELIDGEDHLFEIPAGNSGRLEDRIRREEHRFDGSVGVGALTQFLVACLIMSVCS